MASTTTTTKVKAEKKASKKSKKAAEVLQNDSVEVTENSTAADASAELTPPSTSPSSSKKRKREGNDPEEIEVDISAPEPPSKKALRKLKKGKPVTSTPAEKQTAPEWNEEFEERQAAEEKQAAKRSDYGIWIGNLPFAATKVEVRKFLVDNSEIKDEEITRIHMPAPPDPGPLPRGRTKPQNKGFAYVDFSEQESVKHALDLSETLLVGRRVLIKDAKNFEGRPDKPKDAASGPVKTDKPPSRRIFVGNLGFDTTEGDLREHYARCGQIESIHMATFEDTGKCKGFAWVEFVDIEGGEAAVRGWIKITEEPELSDGEDEQGEEEEAAKKTKKPKIRKWWVNRMKGRPLRVEFAEDKAVRYQKRFGKNAKRAPDHGIDAREKFSGVGEVNEVNSDHTTADTVGRSYRSSDASKEKPRREKDSKGRTAIDVSRLTGGIVAAQGKKTTFG